MEIPSFELFYLTHLTNFASLFSLSFTAICVYNGQKLHTFDNVTINLSEMKQDEKYVIARDNNKNSAFTIVSQKKTVVRILRLRSRFFFATLRFLSSLLLSSGASSRSASLKPTLTFPPQRPMFASTLTRVNT